MTKPIKILDVRPWIPEELRDLRTLAYNLWFVWHHDARELFRRINPDLWEETGKNPVAFLNGLTQEEILGLTRDDAFLAHLQRVKEAYDRYVAPGTKSLS